jgi:hypothetical protein
MIEHADLASLPRRIDDLVAARQQLRARGATATELEWNRLELVRLHRALSHALVSRYLPVPLADAA